MDSKNGNNERLRVVVVLQKKSLKPGKLLGALPNHFLSETRFKRLQQSVKQIRDARGRNY